MQVNHSQKMREKPLTPWVIAEESGKIIAVHCDCMAGLGESCTHVASLLFAIESGVRIRDSMTVTQKKAYWVIPTGVKEVPYAPVQEIRFCGKKRSASMMKSLEYRSNSSSTPSPLSRPSPSPEISPSSTPRASKSPTPVRSIKAPDQDQFKNFIDSLASCPSKPAILSLIEPHSSRYIPTSRDGSLPVCLSELFMPEYQKLNYGELLKIASEKMITVTEAEAKQVETKTRTQSNSRLWFRMRTGRTTASRFKSACHTNLAQPSVSLIMGICHPEMAKFRSLATSWGCEHEKIAMSKYSSLNLRCHHNFSVNECGFFINTEFPFMGASPDGIVNCTCCDEGICEIKVSILIEASNCMYVTGFLTLPCMSIFSVLTVTEEALFRMPRKTQHFVYKSLIILIF